MRLFNFFRNRTEINLTSEQIIKNLLGDIPEHYHSYKQFISYKELVGHGEYKLALDSLIELADYSGHFFSNDFWIGLTDAAEKMELNKQASYCRAQAINTKSKIGWAISKGETVNKIDETHYEHYYSQKVKDDWDNKQREKDNLKNFINKEGFHIKGGRDGILYYISKGKVCEIYWEMSGVPQFDILIGFDLVDSWSLPTKQLLTTQEKNQIETELLIWLKGKNIRADIYPERMSPSEI